MVTIEHNTVKLSFIEKLIKNKFERLLDDGMSIVDAVEVCKLHNSSVVSGAFEQYLLGN